MRTLFKKLMIVFILTSVSISAYADEGMWLYNDMPCQLLKDRYGFEPTSAWL